MAQEKSASLEIESEEIHRNKTEADAILSDKLPALEESRQKVSEIQKSELDYIKSFISPPKLIQMTVNCLQILRVNANANENDGWAGGKLMLSDTSLVSSLLDYSKDEKKIQKVTQKQIKMVNEKLAAINKELQDQNKIMDDVSPACTKLLYWVSAVKLLYETNQIIRPLKDKVELLTKAKAVKEEELKETNEMLDLLTAQLGGLNEKREIKERDLKELTEKVTAMIIKL